MNRNIKRVLRALLIAVVVLAAAYGGLRVYASDYYRAEATAVNLMEDDTQNIKVKDGYTIFYPDEVNDSDIGLIFYPGGKVEAIAYAPLMNKLAQEGFTVVLIEMPYNLAVFEINAADEIYVEFPKIDTWYLAGHSLGGVMASNYAGDNQDQLEGLILMGAYSISDLDIPVLIVYGTEDIALDTTKFKTTDTVVEIAGGNHAYFGNYGEQAGDGTAAITREEQQRQTIEAVGDFANR